MRILWLSHLIPYPPKGGVLQRSHHLLRELARYHEVDLLAFNQKDLMRPLFKDLDSGIEEARAVLQQFCRRLEFFDIECDRTRFGKHVLALKSLISKDPYSINWLKSAAFRETVGAWASGAEYDLIHFDTISLLPFFDVFQGAARTLDHHNIESHMLLRRAQNDRQPLRRLYFEQEGRRLQKYEQKYCPLFDLNITCSEVDRERLAQTSPTSRIVAIPNGVDTTYFHSQGSGQAANGLVFVGTLSWYPNADAVTFIAEELWEELSARVPDISIDIVGANPPRSAIHAAKKHANFRVHGFVDDVRPILERAALYICPIRDGGGTKLKILDAFAMGKAVIANPIACEGIDVADGRDVVFAVSPDDYISRIETLLSDQTARTAIGRNARKLVEEHYSYESIGKRLSLAFERCVAEKN